MEQCLEVEDWQRFNSGEATGHGDVITAVVEGNALKGMNGELEGGHEDSVRSKDWALEAGQETTRTPWLDAGCNKPVQLREE